ncbi:Vps54-domain-containing protein [Poronia punctata]|nr:Vps54-domain-containing protein [Poronia punctata]
MFSNAAARKSVDSLSPWSPTSNEFPLHRPSITTHPTLRRGSTASSIHSIGGQLDSSGNSWSHAVTETGQNAISTLLQPPIVRTGLQPHAAAPASSTHKPPTARDIPPVTLTNIPHVDPSEFKPYLAQVGALYEQLQRMQEADEEIGDQVFRRSSRAEDLTGLAEDVHLRPGSRPPSSRMSSAASVRSLSPNEQHSAIPHLRRRSSSGYTRKQAQGPPPLSTIPTVYFDDDFHLENPRTFDIVSEKSEIVPQGPGSSDNKKAANGNAPAPRKALATNAILQEKLSWYMDTVEMHLISSISSASTTFFTALGSLKELHSEAADSVERIKTLRKELSALDKEIATSGLEIVEKERRRENLQELNDAVRQLQTVVESLATCESLVEAGDLQTALDRIDDLENLIAGRNSVANTDGKTPSPRLRDLRDAVALRGIAEDISALRFRVGKAFESRFLEILLGDSRRHVDDVSTPEVLLRWSSSAMRYRGSHSREPSAFPAYLAKTEELRSQLVPVLVGLHRSKHIAIAIASYREVFMREIRNLLRRPLPASHDDDNESMLSVSTVGSKRLTGQEKSSILARNLRALDEQDAEELFTKIYVSVTETLRRLTTQVKVLFDVASSIGEAPVPTNDRSPSQLKSPPLNSANRDIQEDIHMTMDMANLLGQAVDVAQEKIVKLLRVRTDQSTKLPLVRFLRYFTLNLYFANECESISGRGGTSLKTVVNAHIRSFIQSHGDSENQKLAQAMESDNWNAKDFNENHNALLSHILESSTKDNEAWTDGSKIWIPFSELQNGGETGNANGRPRAESNGATKEKTRSANIDSESFILPNSAILCLEGMTHFLHLITGIPSMAPDISTSLVAYLQLFNSRCTQLILGAGATRSAGLKNITTKHLALAAQALAFISALIPHVREFVRRHAGSGANVNNGNVANLMGDFDRVRRLFQEHQHSIYDKLVDIMSNRASAHVKAIRDMAWDKESGNKVNPYMEILVKETVTLHRVLTKHLPEGVVHMIMAPVFKSYRGQFGDALEAVEAKSETATTRMESDTNYLVARLGSIEGFGDVGDHLLSIIKAKRAGQTAAQEKIEEKREEKASGGKEAEVDGTADDSAQKTSSDAKSPSSN